MKITYDLFKEFERINDPAFIDCGVFKIDDSIFVIEPIFYTQLIRFKQNYGDKFNLVMSKIIEIVKQNKKVIFTADFEMPACSKDDFIYRELFDITDSLHILIDDVNVKDSNYGD